MAVAIVAQAVLGMARTLCPDRQRAWLAALAAVLILNCDQAISAIEQDVRILENMKLFGEHVTSALIPVPQTITSYPGDYAWLTIEDGALLPIVDKTLVRDYRGVDAVQQSGMAVHDKRTVIALLPNGHAIEMLVRLRNCSLRRIWEWSINIGPVLANEKRSDNNRGFFTVSNAILRASVGTALAGGLLAAAAANAQQALGNYGGDLIVSSSTYTDAEFGVGTALPYNASGTGTTSTANTIAGSAFCANANCSSNVWNNVSADANFGITAGIYLQDVNATTGNIDNTVNVTQLAANAGVNLATSFSSKSELAINLSPDGSSLTFMGYNATTGLFDVSNANTPGSLEPGNTDIQTATYRAVGQISLASNALQVTTTNAYNGNNGRAAIATAGGYYLVGNAGNGSGSAQTTLNTGVQYLTAATSDGGLGTNSQVGQYSITQQGYAADKTAKDNNFRGETVYNNTLYVTKGSGSNGIDTAYQVGNMGSLPTGTSNAISVLPGFNTQLAKTDTDGPHPFGLWFANSTTMYVADEGSGATTDFGANPTTLAGGLDKYSLVNGTWQLDYELKGALIGSSYTVNGSGVICGGLGACSLTTTTDGLRNLTGKVNANGTVTLFAVTSTVGSVLGDAGADPNQIVSITDTLSDTSASQVTGENYSVLDTAALGEVYRGVAVAPVPLPASAWLLLTGLGGFGIAGRRRRGAAAQARG